jgi:hypothetical protein
MSPRRRAGEPENEPDMIGRAMMERDVLVLATGGTISMRGQRATPSDGPAELLGAAGLTGVEARSLLGVPWPPPAPVVFDANGPPVSLRNGRGIARGAGRTPPIYRIRDRRRPCPGAMR